jgi:Family of unknown function (DUF6522)
MAFLLAPGRAGRSVPRRLHSGTGHRRLSKKARGPDAPGEDIPHGFALLPIGAHPASGPAARSKGMAMDASAPAIEVRGEEATIEAGFLAAKLGLSVDRLRAEMRKGIVCGVVERGVGEDAGRLRLTVRRCARSWTVVVEADGTLNEAAAPAPAR